MIKKDFLYSISTIGTITVGATGSLVAPDSGTIRFYNNQFEGWDGSQWISFNSGASLGSSLYTTTQYIISARKI